MYNEPPIENLLVSKLNLFSTNYITIDALDECGSNERQLLLRILGPVSGKTKSSIKIFLSSRSGLRAEVTSASPETIEVRIDDADVVSDIETYTRQCLSEKMNMGQLAVGSKVSLDDVCAILIDGVQGMWVSLHTALYDHVFARSGYLIKHGRLLWISSEVEDIMVPSLRGRRPSSTSKPSGIVDRDF